MAFASSIAERSTALQRPGCPFVQGPATLDLLLAEIDLSETALLDACLDLRGLMDQATDAEAAIAQCCRIRRLLDGRHHLAFFRVRRWLQQAIVADVRGQRGSTGERHPLPLDFARVDELVARLSATHSAGTVISSLVQVRFRFVAESSITRLS